MNEEVVSRGSCSKCHCENVIEGENGALVCSGCGYVLSEFSVSEALEFYGSECKNAIKGQISSFFCHNTKAVSIIDRSSHLNRDIADPVEKKKKLVWGLLDRYSRSLYFSDDLIHFAKRIVLRITNNFQVSIFPRKWLISSCIYAAARIRNFPISLIDVSFTCGVDYALLGKYYKKLLFMLPGFNVKSVDPAIYLDKIIGHLTRTYNSYIQERDLHQVIEKANTLIAIAKENFLTTGRKPESISGAVVYLVMNSNEKFTNLARIDEIAAVLKVSTKTIGERIKELKKILVDMGRKVLPWAQKLNKKNVDKSLELILLWYRKQNISIIGQKKSELAVKVGDGELSTTRPISLPCILNKKKASNATIPLEIDLDTPYRATIGDNERQFQNRVCVDNEIGPHSKEPATSLKVLYKPKCATEKKYPKIFVLNHKESVEDGITENHSQMDVRSDPPSYISYLNERMKIQKKIDHAKDRISRCGDQESLGRSNGDGGGGFGALEFSELDEDDLIIQKLLLLGVSEEKILSLNRRCLLESALSRNSKNLCTDIFDSYYFRTGQEIEDYDKMVTNGGMEGRSWL